MEAVELAQLAGLVAWHGPAFLRGGDRISASCLDQYWQASKSRQDGWSDSLADYQRLLSQSTKPARNELAEALLGVMEEVLVSELLTRVWTALVVCHDRRNRAALATPIVRSIYLGHQESRNRTLSLLVSGNEISIEQAVQLNRLRRRCERWTDMLLGLFLNEPLLEDYAFDVHRMRDFASDAATQHHPSAAAVWPLTMQSLRTAFLGQRTACFPEWNAQIAAGVAACFQPEWFDSLGLPRSLWAARVLHVTADTDGLLRELIDLDAPRCELRLEGRRSRLQKPWDAF